MRVLMMIHMHCVQSTDRFWKWGWCLRYPSHVSLMACRSSWWCRADKTPTNTSCTAFWSSVNTILNRNTIISTKTEPNDIPQCCKRFKHAKSLFKRIVHINMNICWQLIYSPSGHLSFFMGTDLEKCSIALLSKQWMLCSEWVPSE